MGRIKNKPLSYEAILLTTLKPNSVFYTDKTDKNMTAIAVFYNVKIKTKRLYVLNTETLKTNRITLVTLI